MGKLQNKVALILGGTSGIGLASAKLFLEEGAKVILTGRKQRKIDAASKCLSGDFEIYQADITDFESTKKAIEKGVAQFGHLDIFYQVAGKATPILFNQATPKVYESEIKTDLIAPIVALWNAKQYLNPHASIIFTSTTFSTRPAPTMSAYGAAKAGLVQFAKSIALEYAEQKIRVNVLSPGSTETPIFDELGLPEDQIKGFKDFFRMVTPLKSLGQPEDLAKAALFLASDDSKHITGITIDVDGGLNQSWHLVPEA